MRRSRLSPQPFNDILDNGYPGWEPIRGNGDEFKSEAAVGIFVNLLEDVRIFETDAARGGCLDETLTSNEEDGPLVDMVGQDAIYLIK